MITPSVAPRYTNGAEEAVQEATPPPPPPKDTWPEPMGEAAHHGVTGEFVRAVEPHTEADPAALLAQFLAAVGSIVGKRASFRVGGTKHHPNLNVVVAGATAKARKGTSWNQVRNVVEEVDPVWDRICVQSGLSTGEGLIHRVRDATVDAEGNVSDTGVEDKRLLVIEAELSRVLRVMNRTDNTLHAVMRDAWDGSRLGIMTRGKPITATGATVSLVAHITIAELKAELTELYVAGGFGNRCLWFAARRSKLLPYGEEVDEAKAARVVRSVREAVEAIGDIHLDVGFTDKARERWCEVYKELSGEDTPGLHGSMTARSEAQVLRVAMIYAILDRAKRIHPDHLEAALEVVRYSNASVRHVFADGTGDKVADTILGALRVKAMGMTRWEVNGLFAGNQTAAKLRGAIELLVERGLIRTVIEKPRSGRPAERLVAV